MKTLIVFAHMHSKFSMDGCCMQSCRRGGKKTGRRGLVELARELVSYWLIIIKYKQGRSAAASQADKHLLPRIHSSINSAATFMFCT